MPGNGFNNNNNRLSDKIKLPKRKVFSCNAGTKSLTISPKGELKLCLEIDYPKYNILRGSLRQGWKLVNDIAEKSENDKNFKCNTCNLRPFCSWCPAMGWLENKSLTACGSLSRNEAENRRNLSLMYSHDS